MSASSTFIGLALTASHVTSRIYYVHSVNTGNVKEYVRGCFYFRLYIPTYKRLQFGKTDKEE
jgi:hypothetical protein